MRQLRIVAVLVLTALFLAMLGSLSVADVVTGAVISSVAVAVAHRAGVGRAPEELAKLPPLPVRLAAVVRLAWSSAGDVLRGSWRAAVWCLSPARDREGLVRVPRAGRSDNAVAAWGILTALGPDELPVSVDTATDELVVHVLDLRRADRVRHDHTERYRRLVRQVFP